MNKAYTITNVVFHKKLYGICCMLLTLCILLCLSSTAVADFSYNPSAQKAVPVAPVKPLPLAPALAQTKSVTTPAVSKALQDINKPKLAPLSAGQLANRQPVKPPLVKPPLVKPPLVKPPLVKPPLAKDSLAYDNALVDMSGLVLIKGSLREQLNKYAKTNGYQIAWNHPNDLIIANMTTFNNGSFLDNIKSLFTTLEQTGRIDMTATVFKGNKTIVIDKAKR